MEAAQKEYTWSEGGSGGDSTADEIEKLAKLRDSGHITGDEFSAQKAKLLA